LIFPRDKKGVYESRAKSTRARTKIIANRGGREVSAGIGRRAGAGGLSQPLSIVEKLIRAGVSLPKELALPPHRLGKGGDAPRKFYYPAHRPSVLELNEKADSKKSAAARHPGSK
jgi:hypothetical protein